MVDEKSNITNGIRTIILIRKIKILQGLPDAIVKRRDLVTSYKTNENLRIADTFLILKSFTTSGKIYSYTKQFKEILPACKITERTFDERLETLVKIGFITIKGKDLYLCSWEKFGEYFDIFNLNFYTINHDTSKQNQKLGHLLAGLAMYEATTRIKGAILKRLSENQEIKNAYEVFNSKQKEPKPFSPENLFEAQKQTFAHGSEVYFTLHSVNPDPNRNIHTIKKQFNFESYRSVQYWKKVLDKEGIIKVEHRDKVICSYPKKKKVERGTRITPGTMINFIVLPKGRKKEAVTWWDINLNQREWYLTDAITFNEDLFANEP